MDGLLYLASIVAVGLVMFWTIRNDQAGATQPTRGLFAMPVTAVAEPAADRRTRPVQNGRRRHRSNRTPHRS